jgi:hypothetical protein
MHSQIDKDAIFFVEFVEIFDRQNAEIHIVNIKMRTSLFALP